MARMFKTSTAIVPLLQCGTYWGPFDWESRWGWKAESEEAEEDRFVLDDFDWVKYKKAICSEAERVLNEEKVLRGEGVLGFKVVEMLSPKEYNFMDDALDLEVEVDDTFFDKAEREIFSPARRKEVEKYIAENWASRDGFFSHMPSQEYDTLRSVFDKVKSRPDGEHLFDEWREFGTVLALVRLFAQGEGVEDRFGNCVSQSEYLTGLVVEAFDEGYTVGDFSTVLERYEVEQLYDLPSKNAAKDVERIRDQYAKYRETDVPEDAKKSAKEFVEYALFALSALKREERSAVDLNHVNGGKAVGAVKKKLKELSGKWDRLCGSQFAHFKEVFNDV